MADAATFSNATSDGLGHALTIVDNCLQGLRQKLNRILKIEGRPLKKEKHRKLVQSKPAISACIDELVIVRQQLLNPITREHSPPQNAASCSSMLKRKSKTGGVPLLKLKSKRLKKDSAPLLKRKRKSKTDSASLQERESKTDGAPLQERESKMDVAPLLEHKLKADSAPLPSPEKVQRKTEKERLPSLFSTERIPSKTKRTKLQWKIGYTNHFMENVRLREKTRNLERKFREYKITAIVNIIRYDVYCNKMVPADCYPDENEDDSVYNQINKQFSLSDLDEEYEGIGNAYGHLKAWDWEGRCQDLRVKNAYLKAELKLLTEALSEFENTPPRERWISDIYF